MARRRIVSVAIRTDVFNVAVNQYYACGIGHIVCILTKTETDGAKEPVKRKKIKTNALYTTDRDAQRFGK